MEKQLTVYYRSVKRAAITNHFNIRHLACTFRKQVFREACKLVLRNENPVSVDHQIPEWQQSIGEWINKPDLWELDKAAHNRLVEIEQMCTEDIGWPEYEHISFEKSICLLEQPLVPSTARILPRWTLQDKANKLPIMKMPKVGDPVKASADFMQVKLLFSSGSHTDSYGRHSKLEIESSVYNQLAMLSEEPFESRIHDVKLPVIV